VANNFFIGYHNEFAIQTYQFPHHKMQLKNICIAANNSPDSTVLLVQHYKYTLVFELAGLYSRDQELEGFASGLEDVDGFVIIRAF
jgi:hypothetical protein